MKTGVLCLLQVDFGSFISPAASSHSLSLADDTFLFFIQPISHLLTPVQGAALPVAQLG